MKYRIHLTDEDYLRFNIFYAHHSKAGKHSINMSRIAFPVLSAALIFLFFIAGAEYSLIAVETVFLAAASIVWCIYVPKIIEKNIRKNILNMKADGRLPFHADSEIEFQDSVIVEANKQGEARINYKDIENIYAEKDYLYIFYSAAEAFIIPYHCLGRDKDQVVEYVRKKKDK